MMYGRGYGYGVDGMMGGYAWFGALLMFLFFVLLVAGSVLMIVWSMRAAASRHQVRGVSQGPAGDGHDEAVAIAKRRLASGEIDTAQYEDIMRALSTRP